MVYGLHILIWGKEEDKGDVTDIQYKSNRKCHCESPLYNEYILIK
jgi:hypothetical protein